MDKDFSVLSQYDVLVHSMERGRGAFICGSDSGSLLLREFTGKPERLAHIAELLEYLRDNGINVDYYIKNVSGEFISTDSAETSYTLCAWFDGKECDIKCFEQVCQALKALGRLHVVLRGFEGAGNFPEGKNLTDEYLKHNRELNKIKNYLAAKRRKNDFELLASSKLDEFLEEGKGAMKILEDSGYLEKFLENTYLCHGDMNYHNVFAAKNGIGICAFDKCCRNIQLVDLYNFMRKLMEKYNWDIKLGYLLLKEYDKGCALSGDDIKILGAMFAYPEKFWKVLNYYYNSNKAWIPAKSMEKLKMVVNQNPMRRAFTQTLV